MLFKSSKISNIAAAICLPLALGLAPVVADAQIGTVTFKNFHRYPASGLWSQELSGTRNGVSLGPPIKETSCSGVTDARVQAMLQKFGETNESSCKTRIIKDTERFAEYEQTCMAGATLHVIHGTMTAIDDKTLKIDTRDDNPGLMRTAFISTVSYLGPCTAPDNKPSAADCAELATARQEAAGAEAQCAQVPGAYRTQCLAQVASSRKAMEAMQVMCQ